MQQEADQCGVWRLLEITKLMVGTIEKIDGSAPQRASTRSVHRDVWRPMRTHGLQL